MEGEKESSAERERLIGERTGRYAEDSDGTCGRLTGIGREDVGRLACEVVREVLRQLENVPKLRLFNPSPLGPNCDSCDGCTFLPRT